MLRNPNFGQNIKILFNDAVEGSEKNANIYLEFWVYFEALRR